MELAVPDLDRIALVVVDVQQGFDDADYRGPRDNPECEQKIAALLAQWCARSRPVVLMWWVGASLGFPVAISAGADEPARAASA